MEPNPKAPMIASKRQLIFYLSLFAVLTGLSALGLWATFQVVAPRLAEASHVLDSTPELFGLILLGSGLTYILKNLFD